MTITWLAELIDRDRTSRSRKGRGSRPQRAACQFRPAVSGLEQRVLLADRGLDPSFGWDGRLVIEVPQDGAKRGFAHAAALQSDGRILIAGYEGVVRLNANGSLDTSFGQGGKTTVTFLTRTGTPEVAMCLALAVQPNGKILTVGSIGNPNDGRFHVARLNGDGTFDSGFGDAGRVSIDTPLEDRGDHAAAVAVQADGKIVVAGEVLSLKYDYSGSDFGVLRLNADGSLDSGFGRDGWAVVAFDQSADRPFDSAGGVVIAPDGGIILAGRAGPAFGVSRLNPDGSLDTRFGEGGRATVGYERNGIRTEDICGGLALQHDGKIVIAGQAWADTNDSVFAVARLNSDGSLDAGFGAGTGRVMIGFTDVLGPGAGSAAARAVAVQPDGKIVVTGGAGQDFSVARLNSDGTPDASFGDGADGLTTIAFPAWLDAGHPDVNDWPNSYPDFAEAVLVQPDGKIVVAGTASRGYLQERFAAARIQATSTAQLGQFQFALATDLQMEADPILHMPRAFHVMVKRVGGWARPASVDFVITGGTETPGSDFGTWLISDGFKDVPFNGTLHFARGETVKIVTIPILDDSLVEGTETLLLALRNPTGGAGLGAVPTKTLTIQDDETSPVPGGGGGGAGSGGGVSIPAVGLVSASSRYDRRKNVSILTLTFDGDLSFTAASALASYRLVNAGRDRRLGTRDDKPMRIKSVTTSGRTVSITPAGQLPTTDCLLSSSRLRDVRGRLIDGDRDGLPGGELAVRLSRRGVSSMTRLRS